MREGESRPEPPGDITRLLADSASGDAASRDRLVELVFAELHRLARAQMVSERAGHTLGATALVSEVYLKLFKAGGQGGDPAIEPWADRHAFFAAAVTAMRRILIDHARSRLTAKRGGGARRAMPNFDADALSAARTLEPLEFLSLDEAISRLEGVDERAAQITRLRFFGGMSLEAAADLAGVSERTAIRDWNFARAWLMNHLDGDGAS